MFPKSRAVKMRQLHRICSDARSKLNVAKAMMSEYLSMYRMARHYIETIMSDRAIEFECNSFMSLCDVIDTLLSVKNKILNLADGSLALRRDVRTYFEDHKLAYGSTNFKPKTHWLFDIADQMADLASRGVDVMPGMFVIERLHQSAKNMSQHVK